jgi:hypothetical protein
MRYLAAALVLVAGCGAPGATSRRLKPEVQAPPEAWAGVASIAVLPPDNWTMDVGLEYITWYRAVAHEILREKGYRVTPLVDINRFFLKNGFNLAGEAGSYTTPELAKHFGVDAVLIWAITSKDPKLMFSLEKADGTPLWCTGEVLLSLKYVAVSGGGFNGRDAEIALALGEILRHMPSKP